MKLNLPKFSPNLLLKFYRFVDDAVTENGIKLELHTICLARADDNPPPTSQGLIGFIGYQNR
jgi:hypothetical protein